MSEENPLQFLGIVWPQKLDRPRHGQDDKMTRNFAVRFKVLFHLLSFQRLRSLLERLVPDINAAPGHPTASLNKMSASPAQSTPSLPGGPRPTCRTRREREREREKEVYIYILIIYIKYHNYIYIYVCFFVGFNFPHPEARLRGGSFRISEVRHFISIYKLYTVHGLTKCGQVAINSFRILGPL